MPHQQDLVAGRGDLGDEDDVPAVFTGWCLQLRPRVHGVAHLVRDGELAVEVVGLIEQNIGVRAPIAGGVRAAALADVGIHVEPAMVEALAQHGGIILAEHSERIERGLLGLLKGDFNVRVTGQWGIDIVHVRFINAHDLLAQGDIAVHLVEVAVHRVDEDCVHRRRHLGHVEREASSVEL